VLIEGAAGNGSSPRATIRTPAGCAIDLANYPEFREVMATGRPARHRRRSGGIRCWIRSASGFVVQKISAIAVVPMACEGTVAGVLFVRSRSRGGLSRRARWASSARLRARRAVGPAQWPAASRPNGCSGKRAERELSQLRRYEEFLQPRERRHGGASTSTGRVLTLKPGRVRDPRPSTRIGRAGLPVPELVSSESTMEAKHALAASSRAVDGVLSADLRVQTRDGRQGHAGGLRRGRCALRTAAPSSASATLSESRELEVELRKDPRSFSSG